MESAMLKISSLLDVSHTMAAPYLETLQYPWETLDKIGEIILEIGKTLPEEAYDHPSEQVWIAKSAKVFPSAWIAGPCIIGEEAEIRHCAFIRGNALVGKNCVVGNSTELKNVILFDGVQVPHFNYVGDSILGYKAHMGAGAITSNVKGNQSLVKVKWNGGELDTGRKKFGAILGDYAEIGCNAVLNPGTVIGRHTQVYPTVCARGVVPENSILKDSGEVVSKK